MTALQVQHSTHMNCSWTISYFPQPNLSERDSRGLVQRTFEKISTFEKYFTVFHDSPFNDLNKYAGKRKVILSHEAISLIQKSVDYFLLTNKQFNICYQGHTNFCDPTLIEIDDSTKEVFLPDERMKISLGGIGKGYAVDMAYDYLKRNGMTNFMVNGSGDLRVHSHINSPRPWRIGITNPFNTNNNIGTINLQQGSIATSGQYLKKKHIHTKFIKTPLAVTVQSDETLYSDVMATYLSGLEVQMAVEKMEELSLRGFIIDSSGKLLRSTSSFKGIKK